MDYEKLFEWVQWFLTEMIQREGIVVTFLLIVLIFAGRIIRELLQKIAERDRGEISRLSDSNKELRIHNAILYGVTKDKLMIMFPDRIPKETWGDEPRREAPNGE